MKNYVVSNVRFSVPSDYVAGQYTPVPSDPDEPYSGEYLNDAIVIYPLRRLPREQRDAYAASYELVPDIPERPPAVRLFISYGKDALGFGETERQVDGRRAYHSEIFDISGYCFDCFRIFVLKSKMVEIHIPSGQSHKKWSALIGSLESTRSAP